jgi:hypothetical protein
LADLPFTPSGDEIPLSANGLVVNGGRTLARPVLALALGLLLVLLGTSLMSRHAARYIFPCYPLLAVIGACAAGTTKLSKWLDARRWVVLGVIFALAAGRVLLAQAVYREVNVLPGTSIRQQPRSPEP